MPWCPVCEKEAEIVRTIACLDGSGSGNIYKIGFCKCDLGITLHDELQVENSGANERMYHSLESRLMIYYNRQFNHYKVRYNEALRIISRYKTGNKFLEVGSNIGFTAQLALSAGFEVHACEIHDRCRLLSEVLHPALTHKKDFFSLDDHYDVMTMCDVLEHFPQPWNALDQARKLLTPSGILFIQLPNHSSSSATRQGNKWGFYNPPDHTLHFTPPTLQKFLENRGFKILWLRTADVIDDSFWIRHLPGRIRDKIRELVYQNPFYHPGVYENKNLKGSIIQCIAQPVIYSSIV